MKLILVFTLQCEKGVLHELSTWSILSIEKKGMKKFEFNMV